MIYGEAGRLDERAPVEASAPERAAPFRIAVAALEAALKESAGLGGVRFLQNRKRVIDLRRKIMTCVAEVSIAGEQAFAGTARSAAFRNAFARMRTAMALHYASWPVVAIELNDPDYRASIQAMRVEYRAFIRWSQMLV